MTSQVIDRGNVMVVVDQYPEKVNGVVQTNPDGSQKMKNKWMKVGEETKWRHDDGRESTERKIYLQPVCFLHMCQKQVTWWESEKQDSNQQQVPQQGFQQQSAPQGNGFQQQSHGGFQNNNQ